MRELLNIINPRHAMPSQRQFLYTSRKRSVYCYRILRHSVRRHILGLFHKRSNDLDDFLRAAFIQDKMKRWQIYFWFENYKGALQGEDLISKLSLTFFYRSIFLQFGTMYLTVIARLFYYVETKVSDRSPFYFQGGGEVNLKILVIFIYRAIFIKIITLFPDIITS